MHWHWVTGTKTERMSFWPCHFSLWDVLCGVWLINVEHNPSIIICCEEPIWENLYCWSQFTKINVTCKFYHPNIPISFSGTAPPCRCTQDHAARGYLYPRYFQCPSTHVPCLFHFSFSASSGGSMNGPQKHYIYSFGPSIYVEYLKNSSTSNATEP